MLELIKKIPKKYLITGLSLILIVFTFFATPTFSRLINGVFNDTMMEWKGDIASSYQAGSGTTEDPYQISTPSELAYFSRMLEMTDYQDTNFILTNDLIMNKGIFSKEENLIVYNYENNKYYLEPYTNNLYTDNSFTTTADVPMYDFYSINNFKGNLDGNFYSIYGLYVTEENKDNIALFNNVSGTIENVFFEHALIYGDNNVSGLTTNLDSATLSNIYVSGFAISANKSVKTEEITIQDVEYQPIDDNFKIDFNIETLKDKNITSATLTGTYELIDDNGNIILKIKEEELLPGELELNLDTNLTDGITIDHIKEEITTEENEEEPISESAPVDEKISTIKLSNLKVEVTYIDTVSAGISLNSTNSSLANVVSKMDLYSANGVGLINEINGSTTITNSYNQGSINTSANSIGLVNQVNENATLELVNTYNSGILTGINKVGILNSAKDTSNVTIKNTFNTIDSPFVGTLSTSNVTLENTYNYLNKNELHSSITTYTKSSSFYKTDFLNNLGFTDFNENEANVWIHNTEDVPSLYYLNELNLIEINVTGNSWNTYDNQAEPGYYQEEISVIITNDAPVYNLKDVKYYISHSSDALSKNELANVEWTNYDGPMDITEEGQYIVYIKLIDYNDKERIINTGLLSIDATSPTAEITFSDNVWSTYKEDTKKIVVQENQPLIVNSNDDNSGVKDISYYVANADEQMTETELESVLWQPYSTGINVEPKGEKIVYARITDNSNNIMLLSTDILVFEGYSVQNFTIGRNGIVPTGSSTNISSESSVRLNYTYQSNNTSVLASDHYVVSSVNLPKNTKLTLIDNISGKKYEYVIQSMDAFTDQYSFNKFSEVGSTNKLYTPSDYIDGSMINENFDLIVDFRDAEVNMDYSNVSIHLQRLASDGTMVRGTISSTVEPFNIYKNQEASILISSTTNSLAIAQNTESSTPINIKTSALFPNISTETVHDSTVEGQDIVIALKFLDSGDRQIFDSSIKDLIVEVDGVEYYADREGTFIVNLKTGLQAIDKVININTYKTGTPLALGNYKVEVSSYFSYGDYSTGRSSKVVIPLTVSDTGVSTDQDFKVNIIGSQLIDTEEEMSLFNFDATFTNFDDPSIKVSFYQKTTNDPVDQTYSLIDLNSYLTEPLTGSGFKYDVTSNNFNLVFDNSKMSNGGYKIVVEAYNGSTIIETKEKKIVVK